MDRANKLTHKATYTKLRREDDSIKVTITITANHDVDSSVIRQIEQNMPIDLHLMDYVRESK